MVSKCQLLFLVRGWLLLGFNLELCQTHSCPKILLWQSVSITASINLPLEIRSFSWILKSLIFKNLLFRYKRKEVWHSKLLSANTLAGISCSQLRGNWYLEWWCQGEERAEDSAWKGASPKKPAERAQSIGFTSELTKGCLVSLTSWSFSPVQDIAQAERG